MKDYLNDLNLSFIETDLIYYKHHQLVHIVVFVICIQLF